MSLDWLARPVSFFGPKEFEDGDFFCGGDNDSVGNAVDLGGVDRAKHKECARSTDLDLGSNGEEAGDFRQDREDTRGDLEGSGQDEAESILNNWLRGGKDETSDLDRDLDDDWEDSDEDYEDDEFWEDVEEEGLSNEDAGSIDDNGRGSDEGYEEHRPYDVRAIDDLPEASSMSLQELLSLEPASKIYKGKKYTQFMTPVSEMMGYKEENPLQYRGRRCPPLDFTGLDHKIPGLGKKTIGCDFARYGDDRTVFVFRYGIHAIDMWNFEKKDEVETANLLMLAAREFEPDEAILDLTGGLGSGCYDILKRTKFTMVCQFTTIMFNEKPRSKKWNALNRRAEMYLILQERFRKGQITIMSDPNLLEELAYIRFEYFGDSSLISIQKKDECKKELGRSPDASDALALSFYDKDPIRVY